ncbi:MAG: hypothetical protein IKV53_07305 [Clostridia bacterium]|nr:hypothetical protein [Clostridia bacterium]
MNSATIEYMSAINTLRDFSEKEAGLSVEIFTDKYPVRYVFTPGIDSAQVSIENEEANTKAGQLVITCGLKTKLENSLKFLIDAATLKKLLRLSEKTSILFYHSFCERALSEQPPPKD